MVDHSDAKRPDLHTPERSLVIGHLIRTPEPAVTSARVAQRLIHAVAEWNPGAGLDITVSNRRGCASVVLSQHGTLQEDWDGDVRWSFSDAAELRPARNVAGSQPNWESLQELRPTRDVSATIADFATSNSADLDRDRFEMQYGPWAPRFRAATPWPSPIHDDLADTAALIAGQPGLALRFRLAPANEIEVSMLGEILNETWPGTIREMHTYLGRPILVRTFLAAQSREVPARLRALARRWATSISVVDVPHDEARSAWCGPVESLVGHAVPEGLALGLVRVPSAAHQPFPGIRTRHPAATKHPIDPVPPKPRTPIRLGSAHTVTGRRVDVMLDVQDLIRHALIEGASGAGKSTILAALVRELTRSGYGCTLLDPHGATVDQILSELPENSHKTYVVRHGDAGSPTPLNVLRGDVGDVDRVIEMLNDMVQSIYDPENTGIVGPRWRRWFSILAKATFLATGNSASLVAVTEIGSDIERVKRLAAAIRYDHPELAKTLTDEIVNDRSSDAASLLAWCTSKLHPLISTGPMRATLGTGNDAVDVSTFIDDGKTLLVDLASPSLGETTSRMLGALWLLKHRMAMGSRLDQTKPHIIVVDEAHLFQFGALPSLLAEGRKFGFGVVVATQFIGQLRSELAESIESNAGTLLTLRTGLPYAHRSSLRLAGWPVEEIVRLPNLTAAASLSRDGTMTEPFTLSIDHHKRMTRTGARGSTAKDRAADVLHRSAKELCAPYAATTPATAKNLDETLTQIARADAERAESTAGSTRYALVLTSYLDSRKLRVIKEVNELTGLGLVSTKDLVESAPSTLMGDISYHAATNAARALEAVGATVQVKPITPSEASPTSNPFLEAWLEKRQTLQTTSNSEGDHAQAR